MRVLIAHSQPRGKYGRYIVTVMIYFSEPTEEAKIQVRRENGDTYSCEHCGKWARINISQVLSVFAHLKGTHFAHQSGPTT